MEATPLPRATNPVVSPGGALDRPGPVAAILAGSLGVLLALFLAGAPLLLLALLGLIVGTVAGLTHPAATTVGVGLLSGFIGTIIAFVGIPVDGVAAGILLCLWLAVIIAYVTDRAAGPLRLLPLLPLAPLALYAVVTLVQMLASESVSFALADFRITVWYMIAVLLFAVAPWNPETFRRIALGLVATALLVGLYSLYRYMFGESPQEFEQARNAVQRVAFSVPVKFYGSFLSAFQLTAWCATMIPLLMGVAFAAKVRWRLMAMVAFTLCVFAVFASDVRTGLVAALAGVTVVITLYMLSRAFAPERLATGLLAVLGILAVGVGGYLVAVSGSEARTDRFEAILNPFEDFAFQERLTRWEAALEVVDDEPLGHGLGTQGTVGQNDNPEARVGPFNLDSAYLKVGIQQGYLVMLLFVGAQLALLAGIAHRAILVQDRWRCALGIAACGTLVAQMVLFFTGIYSEGITSLIAWIVVGIGAAQLSSAGRRESPPPGGAAPA